MVEDWQQYTLVMHSNDFHKNFANGYLQLNSHQRMVSTYLWWCNDISVHQNKHIFLNTVRLLCIKLQVSCPVFLRTFWIWNFVYKDHVIWSRCTSIFSKRTKTRSTHRLRTDSALLLSVKCALTININIIVINVKNALTDHMTFQPQNQFLGYA